MANERGQNQKGGIKSIRSHTQKQGCPKRVHVRTKEDVGRIEKLIIRSTHTKWIAPNKCHGVFFVHWSGQVP